MKVYPTIRPICDHCKVIRRNGRVVVVHRGTTPCAGRES